jgi:signal transduction histidine kinase
VESDPVLSSSFSAPGSPGLPSSSVDPLASDTLLAIASLGTRTDDANFALGEILSLISRAIPADSGAIALLNPDSGKLETETTFGLLPSDSDLSFALGQGIPGWVAWHGRPALAFDTADDPRYRAGRAGVRCQMAAPLLATDEQVLGVVTLERDAPHAYSSADLARLVRFSEEAARVMHRLWQLGHLTEKARQLETLLTTGQSLVSQLEQDELFKTLARDTRQMMRTRACALYVYDAKRATVRVASFAGAAASPPLGDLAIDSCLIAAAIHTRRPVSFADIQSPEFLDLVDLPRDPALRSVLAMPVACEGEVLGVLVVFSDRVQRFDNDEKRLCAAIAGLGAVALQNARLYARVFQSEESLRRNERLTTLGLLAAEIAHEIRNPLTVLKLLLGGIGLDFPEGDPRRTDMRVVGEKLDQLEAIVSRVLNFAKAPTSLHTRCSLADIVEDTLVLIRPKLAQSKIHVRFTAPPLPLIVDGHEGQLQQVLLNLLINALQAMPDGGVIAITLTGQAASAALEIADTGTGVPDAIRDRIFDSFLSSRPEGTGLGLSIAKRVLLGHHGDIAVLATGPGGTTFRVTLPLAKG